MSTLKDEDMMMPLSDDDGGDDSINDATDQALNNSSSTSMGNNKIAKKKRNRKRKKKTIILPAGLKPFEKLYVTNLQNNTTTTTSLKSESSSVVDSTSVNNVEYIQKDVIQEIEKKEANSSVLDEFKRIFDKFGTVEDLNAEEKEEEEEKPEKKEKDLFELTSSDEEQYEDEEEDDGEELDYDQASLIANKKGKKKNKLKKKKKRRYVFTISQLKQLAKRPDVVEVHDITAKDPQFLVFLKSYRNTVPVPTHWSQKRKYLQGKRGFVKPPFKLPEFIAKTGIQKMREAYEEKENEKSIKQKMRERVRPKLGKMDIDYQVLRDAFYKHQTKPDNLAIHGDLYYEGKEYEQRRKYINKYKAGKPLSERLRLALGMPVNAPPPWLIKMQEHGPPPSYTNLRIPGLNAPIPEGASYGYHPGGWGRLPVDHMNRPLYNKFFGANANDEDRKAEEKVVKMWGEEIIDDTIEEEEEEQEETEEIREGGDTSDEETQTKDEEEDDDESNVIVVSGLTTPKPMAGNQPSSSQRIPEVVNLRKDANQKSDDPKLLYRVLEEKDQTIGSRDMMGSSRSYASNSNMLPPSQQPNNEDDKKRKRNDKPSSQKKFKF